MSKPSTDSAERDSARGGWALGGFMFGGASSLGLNLEAAWLQTTSHAPYGKQAAAVMWPLLLIFSVEVMSRTAWPETKGWKTWGWLAVRFGGFGTIGITSAVISYGHVHTVLISWQYTEAQARSGAFCLDALMVLCGFARLAAGKTPVAVEAADQTGVSTLPGDAAGPEDTSKISSGPVLTSTDGAAPGAAGPGAVVAPPASPGPAPLFAEGVPLPTGTAGREGTASHGQSSSSPALNGTAAPLAAVPPTGRGGADLAPAAPARSLESASADAAQDADVDAAETAAVVHLVPASSRSADAPRTASGSAPERASRTASGRGASAAMSASRPARITASADAPGTASDLLDPALVDAARTHLRMHGKLPSGRGLAKQMRVHQGKAAAAIKHVADHPEVTT